MPLIDTHYGPLNISDHRSTGDSVYPPLLLIHGAGASRLVWTSDLRRIQDAGVIAVDLPGHGRSPGPACASIPAYADALIALMDALGQEQVIACGHSMGGAIAQQMAISYPERVAGLVLIATGARLRIHYELMVRSQHDAVATAELLDSWLWSEQTEETLKALARKELLALPAGTLHSDYLACDHFDSRPYLSQIAVPSLVIAGTADRVTPPRLSATLAAGIAHAESVTLTGAGHYLILEQPEAVAQAISGWLARHPMLLQAGS